MRISVVTTRTRREDLMSLVSSSNSIGPIIDSYPHPQMHSKTINSHYFVHGDYQEIKKLDLFKDAIIASSRNPSEEEFKEMRSFFPAYTSISAERILLSYRDFNFFNESSWNCCEGNIIAEYYSSMFLQYIKKNECLNKFNLQSSHAVFNLEGSVVFRRGKEKKFVEKGIVILFPGTYSVETPVDCAFNLFVNLYLRNNNALL